MNDPNLTQSQVDQIVQSNMAILENQKRADQRMDKMSDAITDLAKTMNEFKVVENELLHTNTKVIELDSYVRAEIKEVKDDLRGVEDDVKQLQISDGLNIDLRGKINLLLIAFIIGISGIIGTIIFKTPKQAQSQNKEVTQALEQQSKLIEIFLLEQARDK